MCLFLQIKNGMEISIKLQVVQEGDDKVKNSSSQPQRINSSSSHEV